MSGWDPQANPESPLSEKTGPSQFNLKIPRTLSDTFKKGEWWTEKINPRGAEGCSACEEVEVSLRG